MTDNCNLNLMTNHTCGSVLSHAHNVFEKNGFCEHGNCVKMNVHIENINVGRENLVL